MRFLPNSMNIKHSHTENGSAPREVTLVLIQGETILFTLPPPQAGFSHPLLVWFGHSIQMLMSNLSLMIMVRTFFGSESYPDVLETSRIPKWFKRVSNSQRCYFREIIHRMVSVCPQLPSIKGGESQLKVHQIFRCNALNFQSLDFFT